MKYEYKQWCLCLPDIIIIITATAATTAATLFDVRLSGVEDFFRFYDICSLNFIPFFFPVFEIFPGLFVLVFFFVVDSKELVSAYQAMNCR